MLKKKSSRLWLVFYSVFIPLVFFLGWNRYKEIIKVETFVYDPWVYGPAPESMGQGYQSPQALQSAQMVGNGYSYCNENVVAVCFPSPAILGAKFILMVPLRPTGKESFGEPEYVMPVLSNPGAKVTDVPYWVSVLNGNAMGPDQTRKALIDGARLKVNERVSKHVSLLVAQLIILIILPYLALAVFLRTLGWVRRGEA